MRIENVILPNGAEIALCFEADHPAKEFDPMNTLSVLQLRKDGKCPKEFGNAYDKEAEKIASKFADDVLKQFEAIDIIVVPASESKQFGPFLNAFVNRNVATMDADAITKEGHVRAGEGVSYQELLLSYAIDESKWQQWPKPINTCLILDDIFGRGDTIAATLEILKQRLTEVKQFVAACPLRIDQSKTR